MNPVTSNNDSNGNTNSTSAYNNCVCEYKLDDSNIYSCCIGSLDSSSTKDSTNVDSTDCNNTVINIICGIGYNNSKKISFLGIPIPIISISIDDNIVNV